MKLVYFSWIREKVGVGEEDIALPDDVATVGDLLVWLKGRDEAFANVFRHDRVVRVAVDHEHVEDRDTVIAGAREIALFPPMTGG
ncbi:MAG: molybdopterin synthase sulfur carrier subunit [Alphaproteobacteria bacterium]|nr:MAG: molybdopterin synthase sulfur carrier subunit [Alphaproteobacteria bacterium]